MVAKNGKEIRDQNPQESKKGEERQKEEKR